MATGNDYPCKETDCNGKMQYMNMTTKKSYKEDLNQLYVCMLNFSHQETETELHERIVREES